MELSAYPEELLTDPLGSPSITPNAIRYPLTTNVIRFRNNAGR
jgi:hypothetical protein